MVERVKFLWEVLLKAAQDWASSNAMRNSASIAYYAIFSIPGLLIIIIWLAGYFFGEEAIRGEISHQISEAVGYEAAQSIEQMVAGSLIDKDNILMKTVGVFSLVFGATTLFFQLQKSLNDLWSIEPAPKKALMNFVLSRANSLGMILIIGFLMTITMIFSSVVSFLNGYITHSLGFETYNLMQIVNFSVGFILTTLVFAFMFKVLPDVQLGWRLVWPGALLTSFLFTAGKFILSYYFTWFQPTSAFGTAGTIVLVMMWINYSCMLVFFGAEFTRVFAAKSGHAIKPSRFASWNRLKQLEAKVGTEEEE